MSDLVIERPQGLYCPPGDFYIDPWRPVDRAVITHAHADHARVGHGHYLASQEGEAVLRSRLGAIALQPLAYGEVVTHHGVRISLHPAGHVLGSSQVRLEHGGEVWVASGDYFVSGAAPGFAAAEANPTCSAFEPVRCHCFITESTFGLPIYRWQPQAALFADVNAWWAANAAAGRASLLMGYSFGKAQRLLAGVDASIGPIVVHGAVQALNLAYRASGVALPETRLVTEVTDAASLKRALVVAPPSVHGSVWARRFGAASDAFASGWMQLRGARRRRGVDRGFVLSDHADWPGLQRAIAATGAERVIVTHGYEAVMVRWLQQQGLQAGSFRTEYGDRDDEPPLPAEAAPASDEAAPAGGKLDAPNHDATVKILLPVDGSPNSLAAVRHALALHSAGLSTDFVLINVQAPASLYEVVVAHDVERLSDLRRAAGADLLAPAEALLRAAGAGWESEVAGGEPATLLVELLENYGCDAVVMGAATSGAGSVTQALLQHSPVPVTVVREPSAADG